MKYNSLNNVVMPHQDVKPVQTQKTSLTSNNEARPFLQWLEPYSKMLSIVKEKSAAIYWVSAVILLCGIVCVFGLLIDERTIMGVNVWIKPLKFSISIALYLLTAGFLITKYPYSKKKKNIINHITAWTLLLEFGVIFLQASRGVPSHFNKSTPLDGILFLSMGIMIGINVLIMVMFILDTLRMKLTTSKPIQWAILQGWSMVFIGSWVGGQMISQAAHSVGAVDGGAGLPLVNWSTVAGDLRIAHFFALHGIQIIPLFAFLISKNLKSSTRSKLILVTLFGLLFAAWVGFVFYSAKQGIPLIAA